METGTQRLSDPYADLSKRRDRQRVSSTLGEEPEIALRTNPDGTVEEIPLTREILLNPCFEIQVPQNPPHRRELKSLDVRLEHQLSRRDQGDWYVYSDVILKWPNLRKVSPDLSLIQGLKEKKPGEPAPKSLDVAAEGCRVRVVFEIVSPGALERWKDEERNPPLFAKAGVDVCVLVYLPEYRKPEDPPIRVFSKPSPQGYTEQKSDARGRFLLRPIGVRIRAVKHRDGREEIVLSDSRTGKRLPDAREEAQRADDAENRADKAEQQADDAMKAMAETVVTILEKRGVNLDSGVRRRILDCRDAAELDRLLERAWSVDSVSELLVSP